MNKKVFLIGFMGAGKTTVGKKLANKLNYNFIDLDNHIEQKHRHTISSIFDLVGEEGFRKIEHETLKEVATSENDCIISLGGGTPCFSNNLELIKKNGIAVYLKYSPEILHSRIKNSGAKRPLVRQNKDNLLEFITKKLSDREKFYSQADIIYSSKNLKIEELIAQIKNF